MSKKQVLLVVTSNDRLGNTGGATGSWLEELAVSYFSFVDAGLEVAIASPKGGKAPLDPASLEAPWISDVGRRFLDDPIAGRLLANTVALPRVRSEAYDAVLVVGGAGGAWDFPSDVALAKTLETLNAKNRVVAGVCHGVLGLTSAKATNGSLLVAGRAVTGVSDAEEKLVGYEKIVPLLPEQRMIELGAQYSRAKEPFEAHVVRDGNLLTGQNPASTAPLAHAIVQMLRD